MSGRQVHLTKEKETLLITLYAKAIDSRSSSPILGDKTAQEAVEKIDYDFTKFTRNDSVGAAARAKLLDLYTKDFLSANPNALVLHLGCGLDGRCFRVAAPDGVLWYDVDYAEVIDLRRELYAHLYDGHPGWQMIGASVTDPDWLEQLPADRPVMVVAEGLVEYLPPEEVNRLLQRVTDQFGDGELAFDVISPLGVRFMNRHPSLKLTGAVTRWGMDNPHELEQVNPRLKFLGEEYTVNSRVVPDMPLGTRIACHVMNLIPPLRKLAGLVRYQFGSRTSPA